MKKRQGDFFNGAEGVEAIRKDFWKDLGAERNHLFLAIFVEGDVGPRGSEGGGASSSAGL